MEEISYENLQEVLNRTIAVMYVYRREVIYYAHGMYYPTIALGRSGATCVLSMWEACRWIDDKFRRAEYRNKVN
jgi:hypothetical protein